MRPVIDYVQNFGFTKEQLPNNLTLALGSMGATPLEVATGFAVFANGGYQDRALLHRSHRGPRRADRLFRRAAHGVCRVRAAGEGRVGCRARKERGDQRDHRSADAARAATARRTVPAERVISPQVSFLMNDIMKDVITRGTGRRALALGRSRPARQDRHHQ